MPDTNQITSRLDSVEKKVTDLLFTRKLVYALAAIFGVTSTFGFVFLKYVEGNLTKVEENLTKAQKDLDTFSAQADAKREAIAEQLTELDKQLNGEKAAHPVVQSVTATSTQQSKPRPFPFMADVQAFRSKPAANPYTIDNYKDDLRGLEKPLLGYLGYLQSNSVKPDFATSKNFFDELRGATNQVKEHLENSSLSQIDTSANMQWHTQSLDNFNAIIHNIQSDLDRSPNNSLPTGKIVCYEADIEHWRKGVFEKQPDLPPCS